MKKASFQRLGLAVYKFDYEQADGETDSRFAYGASGYQPFDGFLNVSEWGFRGSFLWSPGRSEQTEQVSIRDDRFHLFLSLSKQWIYLLRFGLNLGGHVTKIVSDHSVAGKNEVFQMNDMGPVVDLSMSYSFSRRYEFRYSYGTIISIEREKTDFFHSGTFQVNLF